jgi:peptide/nickel transport system substrate-binding protein
MANTPISIRLAQSNGARLILPDRGAFLSGLALCLAWLLASCGPEAADTNTLRVGIGLEPPNLDPTSGAAAAVDEVVYANVFEGLTRIDAQGQVRPGLAQSWDVSADGLTYDFELRRGVDFHNGAAFDANVAKFALSRITAPGSTNAQQQLFAQVKAIEVLAPLTLRIRLKQRVPEFLFNLGWGDAVMVEPQSAASNAFRPVGTGPFEFVRWQTGTAITLQRFDRYWGALPAFRSVVFKLINDAGAAYGAVMAGDVDGVANFGTAELLPQIKRTGRFTVTEGMTEGETILAMNNARAPFDDVRVRRAVALAIDRKAVIDGALFGYGAPIGSFFSPLDPDYIDLTDRSPFDQAKAKALLAEAGYGQGFAATLVLPPTGYARRGGEIIAAQLRQIGVTAKIENIEWAQWLDRVLQNKSYDMTIVSHTEPDDIGFFARPENYFNYSSAAFQAAITARDFKAAQRILADDQPAAFLFQLPQVGVWRKELTGQWANAPIQAIDVTQMRWRAQGSH